MATKIPALPEPWVPGCKHNLRSLLIEERSASQILPKFGAQEGSFTPRLVCFSVVKPSAHSEVSIQVQGGRDRVA